MISIRSIAAVTAAGSMTVLAGLSFGVAPASAAPAITDATFVTMNQQSNLAEIALGTLAMSKGQKQDTKQLARVTHDDHVKASAKLTAAGKQANATLPTAPNAAQRAIAAQLAAAPASSFDLMYAQAQVTAHQQALAIARREESSTKNADLKTYTKFYIGIATMHLQMARDEVSALGGTPTSVPAGSGGQAATDTSTNDAAVWGIGGGVLVIAVGGVLMARRRQAQS
jgi:putative membrane protein